MIGMRLGRHTSKDAKGNSLLLPHSQSAYMCKDPRGRPMQIRAQTHALSKFSLQMRRVRLVHSSCAHVWRTSVFTGFSAAPRRAPGEANSRRVRVLTPLWLRHKDNYRSLHCRFMRKSLQSLLMWASSDEQRLIVG